MRPPVPPLRRRNRPARRHSRLSRAGAVDGRANRFRGCGTGCGARPDPGFCALPQFLGGGLPRCGAGRPSARRAIPDAARRARPERRAAAAIRERRPVRCPGLPRRARPVVRARLRRRETGCLARGGRPGCAGRPDRDVARPRAGPPVRARPAAAVRRALTARLLRLIRDG